MGGEDLANFDEIVRNPMWVVSTREMWGRVTLDPTGWLDGRAVGLLAKCLALAGFRIVKSENSHSLQCGGSRSLCEECPMVLYDGSGHFKALIPLWKPTVSDT